VRNGDLAKRDQQLEKGEGKKEALIDLMPFCKI